MSQHIDAVSAIAACLQTCSDPVPVHSGSDATKFRIVDDTGTSKDIFEPSNHDIFCLMKHYQKYYWNQCQHSLRI